VPKKAEPEVAATAAPAEEAKPMPTGIVKRAGNKDHSDVTKWMDMASTKSPAQIAKEEKAAKDAKEAQEAKLAKEAKAAQDAKLAQEAKALADAKQIAAKAREAAKQVAVAPIEKPLEVNLPSTIAAAPAKATTLPSAGATAAEVAALKVISSVQPKYPSNAAREGILEGVVSARIHIETDGRVSQVEILKANPNRYFGKEVIAAVSQWRYSPIAKPQTTLMEFAFKL